MNKYQKEINRLNGKLDDVSDRLIILNSKMVALTAGIENIKSNKDKMLDADYYNGYIIHIECKRQRLDTFIHDMKNERSALKGQIELLSGE